LLTNTRNWSTPQLNHQNCSVYQQVELFSNTTVGVTLAW
jgi:hypothetical protein